MKSSDIIYSTRIQRERFEHPKDYESIENLYILTKEKIQSLCKKDVSILHPLPRTNEIDTGVDEMSQAAYFRQAQNGLYVRMALFLLVLGRESDIQ